MSLGWDGNDPNPIEIYTYFFSHDMYNFCISGRGGCFLGQRGKQCLPRRRIMVTRDVFGVQKRLWIVFKDAEVAIVGL